MTLYKTIAGYFDKNKNWVEQKDVELTENESNEIKAFWKLGDHAALKPVDLSKDEKVELLLDRSKGIDYIEAKRLRYASDLIAWEEINERLKSEHKVLSKILEKDKISKSI